MDNSSLNYNHCTYCNKPLPKTAKYTCCPQCEETILFHSVREYIRDNDVNEFQVAEHFDIPLRKVKDWIREGRIEYKTSADGKNCITSIRCSRCGAPASFGTLCKDCLKLLNKNVHGYGSSIVHKEEHMRFLDTPKNNP